MFFRRGPLDAGVRFRSVADLAFAVGRAAKGLNVPWIKLSHVDALRFSTVSVGIFRWGVLGGVVMGGLVGSALWSSAVAGPPFPWRSRAQGPVPYTQREPVPPTPRTRSGVAIIPAQGDQSLKPLDLTPPEPTPVDPSEIPVANPRPPSRRTYYTARRPEALFPSGHGVHIAQSEKLFAFRVK